MEPELPTQAEPAEDTVALPEPADSAAEQPAEAEPEE